ncbi:hypothetical protein Cgig2_033957 [Carnegiea gigantea]|uniref:Uncharacterized protein n=1 Tax=Carnegiea gigantea TaxID=171969 RepID=A0A9Q1KD88_9CARY|nr:hypothetical protein Cgig2_033957 [Carnegiea gigantea]
MVINDAAELRLLSRGPRGSLMLDLHELRWYIIEVWLLSIEERLKDTQVPCLVKMIYNPQLRPEVTSRLRDTPPLSSDEYAKTKSIPRVRTADELWPKACKGHPLLLLMGRQGARPRGERRRAPHPRRASHFRKSVLTRKGRSPSGPVPEIVAEGAKFPEAPARLDPQDGPSSHFPNPKVVPTLKRTSLEKEYRLPAGYNFVISKVDATVNELPARCISVYRTALNYGLRFPLHPVIVDILTRHELAPTQIVPTSWHNICSFIATCELRSLTCTARAFNLVHIIQMDPNETRDLGWYYFNN